MKIKFFNLREFDELEYCKKMSYEYGIAFDYVLEYPNHQNIKETKGYDAICITPCLLTKEDYDALHENGVKFILARSIGYDHIDLAYCKELGIRVANCTYPPDCVANFAVMLMLMLLRQIPEVLRRNDVQDYSLKGKIGKDISSMTVGVIGTGNIGKTVIKNLSGFGCNIIAYDKYQNEDVKKYAEYVDLDTLYKSSDIITLHTPSNDETFHMINDESIQKMKKGVYIINTARGNLIDTKALIRNIKNGYISGAGLDVLENESGLFYVNCDCKVIDNDDMAILKSFPNVILSSHTSFYTDTTVYNMIKQTFLSLDLASKGLENKFEKKI